MTLTQTSLKGAFWLGLLKVVIKAFSLVKLIVIARILTPFDLGLFGIIMLPYGLVEVATESGINQALVQSRKDHKLYLSSAWLAFIFRGFLLFLALYLSAPFISRYYQQDLTLMIRLVALTPLLKGLANPGVIMFKKYFQYKQEFFFQAIISLSESVGTIIFCLWLRSVIALPLGVVIGGVSTLIISFFVTQFDWVKPQVKKILELYRYGRWVTLGTFISYVNDQGDDFLVSKVLGANALGFYQTAYKISNLPTTQGAGLIYQVIFPLFSSIQNETVRLKRGLIKALLITFALSFGFSVVVYLLAPFAVNLFFGPNWMPLIPALNVLLLFGLTRPLISVGAAVFDAIGQPKTIAGLNLIRLLIMVILLFPLTKTYGIVGTAWAVVIAQICVYPWFIVKLKQVFS
jgi:O-antigen/teichoic acid export membrane protein